MILQTIRTFYRTLVRNKALAAINILGLALGFSSCILITLYLFDQLGYDSYHTNLDRIYRINTRFVSEGSVDHVAIAASPLPGELKNNYPEVEECVRLDRKGYGVVIRNHGQALVEEDVYSADAGIFNIFTYDFLDGHAATALSGPNKVVLTRSAAIKYFGNVDVVGKTLDIDKKDRLITGVMEDVPENSDIRFSLLMSRSESQTDDDWFDFSYYVFVLFKPESLENPGFLPLFQKKLQKIADDNINADIRKENIDMSVTMEIQPLRDLHFDNTLTYDTPKGNRNYVYIFLCVAGLILFIACVNYINFSIVQSMEKSREVGIRKVVGSSFFQLFTRYIVQSFLLTFSAGVIAIGFVYLLLPLFNEVVARHFSMSDLYRADILLALGVILTVTGLLAGSYPAFYGSSINIVSALKGQISSPGGKAVRKISVAVQFAVSLGLIICTFVIYSQMTFVRNYDLGFRKENVLAIRTPEDSSYYQLISAFRNDLVARTTLVRDVTIAGDGGLPGDPDDEQRGTLALTNGSGIEEVRMVNYTYIDPDYFSVLGVQIKSGRAYENGSLNDEQNAIMVNEALVEAMQWQDPLAQKIKWGDGERQVIGVVGNIYYKSLYNPVQAQVFVPQQHRIVNVLIALKTSGQDSVDELRKLWQKHFPDQPFVYRYLDDTLNEQYKQERTAATISTYFSVLTIAISILGIFGLSLLTAYQRKREIGIRKIVGANFIDIVKLFFTEYLLLLALALIIISPIAWYIMERWLTMFVDHTQLEVAMFISVGAAFGALALVAIILSIRKVAGLKTTELIRAGT